MLVIKSNQEATFLTKDYAAELAKIPEEKFYNLVQAANTAHSPLRTSKKKVKYQVLYYVKITNLIYRESDSRGGYRQDGAECFASDAEVLINRICVTRWN